MTLTKIELQNKLIKIIEELPSQEEDKLLDFDLGVINDGQQLLTDEAKQRLIKQIKSAKTTKVQLRRAFALLSGLTKIALMFA